MPTTTRRQSHMVHAGDLPVPQQPRKNIEPETQESNDNVDAKPDEGKYVEQNERIEHAVQDTQFGASNESDAERLGCFPVVKERTQSIEMTDIINALSRSEESEEKDAYHLSKKEEVVLYADDEHQPGVPEEPDDSDEGNKEGRFT